MAPTRGSEDHVKVVVQLERDEDDYPPADSENLWADAAGAGLYRINNIPFFAKGIALGDIVSAEFEAGQLLFKQVIKPSGHSTLRLFIQDKAEVPALMELLVQKGCSCEGSHIPGLISVDVPPSVLLGEVRRLLEEGAEQEKWAYEEACIALG